MSELVISSEVWLLEACDENDSLRAVDLLVTFRAERALFGVREGIATNRYRRKMILGVDVKLQLCCLI